ncbi:MAG: hypothetical protein QOJ12_361 [Thermoleophilales bacterium]|jgi:hypothetical protein|nr:hypothetical protein [Thermoleophilales bacterium]
MVLGPHTGSMLSPLPFLAHTALRRSLLGALAGDPVVPDGRPDRRRRAPELARTPDDNVRELPAAEHAPVHRRAA